MGPITAYGQAGRVNSSQILETNVEIGIRKLYVNLCILCAQGILQEMHLRNVI